MPPSLDPAVTGRWLGPCISAERTRIRRSHVARPASGGTARGRRGRYTRSTAASVRISARCPNAPAPASSPPPQSSLPLLNPPRYRRPSVYRIGSPGAPAPRGSAAPAGSSPYSAWAAALAKVIDVTARALQAYAGAQETVAREQPGCHLSWTSLASIARIESNHGRFGGRGLQPDGRPSSPIVGVRLDGSPGVRAIPIPTVGC